MKNLLFLGVPSTLQYLSVNIYLSSVILNCHPVFYSLLDGRPLTTLDTTFLSLDPGSVQTWQISDDLRLLLLAFQTGNLLHIDLEQSAPNWSALLQRDRNESLRSNELAQNLKSSRSSLQTCHIGDPSWREKLVSLHQRPGFKGKFPGSNKQKLTETGVGKRQLVEKHKVTGFKRKDQHFSTAVGYCPLTLEAPKELQGYSVEGVSIGVSCVTLVYTYNDVSVLCTCNVETGSWTLQRYVYHTKSMYWDR